MLVNNCTKVCSITSPQYKRMMPELILELLGSHHHCSFLDVRVYLMPSPRVISRLVQLQPSRDTRVINVELMKSVFVRSNEAALHLLCSPRGACMGGLAATVTYRRLASLLSVKWNSPYPVIMGWLHYSLGFSLLHSALMCLCGSRSRVGSPGVNHHASD